VVALVIALAGCGIAFRTTMTSLAWIDRVFPGFMLLDNRVVASVGLADWTGTSVPELYQSEVIAVQGRPVHSTPEVYAAVRAYPPGTVLHYDVRRGGVERDVDVASELFGVRDWFLLYGVFLLNGLVFL